MDNISAKFLAENGSFNTKMKHIDISYHFIKEQYEEETIKPSYIPDKLNLADALTKAVTKDKFTWFLSEIGLREIKR